MMPQDNAQPHDSNEPTASVEELENLYGKEYWLTGPSEGGDMNEPPKRPKKQLEKGRLIALIVTSAATVVIIIVAAVLSSGSY